MRHDKKVTVRNLNKKIDIKKVIKTYRKKPSSEGLTAVFSILDKAVKTNFFHKNKSSRLKSRLSKLLAK